jgi:hypothetical protein
MRGGADEADGPPSDVGAQLTDGPPSDVGAQLTDGPPSDVGAQVTDVVPANAKALQDAIEEEDWDRASDLVDSNPALAIVKDSDGALPLHLAVENWTVESVDIDARLRLVDGLIEANRGGLAEQYGDRRATPLWMAVWEGAPLSMVKKLVEAYTPALNIKSGKNVLRTPLEAARARNAKDRLPPGVYEYLNEKTVGEGLDKVESVPGAAKGAASGGDDTEAALKLKARLEATESPWSVPFARAMGLQMRRIINNNQGRGITNNLWKDLFEELTDEEKHFAKIMQESHSNKAFAKRATAPLVKIIEAHIKPKDTQPPPQELVVSSVAGDFGGSQTYEAPLTSPKKRTPAMAPAMAPREEVSSTTGIETKKVSSTTGSELSAGAPQKRGIDFFLDRILFI